MKWNTRRTEIFLINSKEEGICPCCGSPLKYRDSRKRVHKIAGGGKECYLIRRLRCSSDKCRRLHNELPDCMCPYKHYDAGLIEDVVDGVVSEEDTETEDYPCEGTIVYGLGAISGKDTKSSIQRCQIITGRRMEKAVQKAAVNREVNNCVYNWTSDRITGRFATANEVKSVTSHEVINTSGSPVGTLSAPQF